MKVLHLLTQTELTGSEVYAQIVAEEMRRRGHECSFVSDDFHIPMPGSCSKEPVSTARGLEKWSLVLRLRRQIQLGEFDVVHCHSRGAARVGYWAALGLAPMVTTLHGEQHVSWSKKLFDLYGLTVMTVADAIRDQLVQVFKMRPEKIKIVRNPLAWALDLHRARSTKNARETHLFIAGRDSGPKGERLRSFLKHELIPLMLRNPMLKVSILEGHTLKSDFQETLQRQLFEGSIKLKNINFDPRMINRLSFSELENSVEFREDFAAASSRIRWVHSQQGLEKFYLNADLVIGGGRIALEAASLGCEVVVFGEKQSLGWLNAHLWPRAIKTNFGDMGESEHFSPQFIGQECDKALALLQSYAGASLPQGTRSLSPEQFADYNLQKVGDELEHIYRGARMAFRAPHLPILMYHKILEWPEDSPHRIFVTQKTFERHLQFFKWMGFQTLTFQELTAYWFEKRSLKDFPRKAVLLTFDDGYRNNLHLGGPLLVRYGAKATLFLLANKEFERNLWDKPSPGDEESMALLNPEERARIEQFGFSVESHGLNHEKLTELDEAGALHEMTESRKRLGQEFKKDICCFAYAFGAIDERLPGLAKKAGYSFAVNTDRGGLRWFDEPHSLFRVSIFPEDGWFDLWRKTLPWYRLRYFRKRRQ